MKIPHSTSPVKHSKTAINRFSPRNPIGCSQKKLNQMKRIGLTVLLISHMPLEIKHSAVERLDSVAVLQMALSAYNHTRTRLSIALVS